MKQPEIYKSTRGKMRGNKSSFSFSFSFILLYVPLFFLSFHLQSPISEVMGYSIYALAHRGQEHEKYEKRENKKYYDDEEEENHQESDVKDYEGEGYDSTKEVADGGDGEETALTKTTEIILDPGRIFSHMHNKIVHFPIALGIVAGVFDILSFFNPTLSQAGKIILALTTAGAVGAFISGKAIEEEMEEEYTDAYEGVLEIHESLGFLAMSIYIIAFLLRLSPKTDKLSKLIVILSVPLISFVGYLGGILAH